MTHHNAPLAAAVVLSVLSAVAYAVAAVVQERLAALRRAPAGPARLLTSGAWSTALGLNGAGAALHVGALAYGSLAVVQPLGALTLVVALPIGAVLTHRTVRGREWRGALATVAGLAGLLLATDTGAPKEALGDREIVLLGLVTAAIVAILTVRPVRTPVAYGGLLPAAGAGIAFAVSTALTQTVLLRLDAAGPTALRNPVLVAAVAAIVAFAAAGLLLSQVAYRQGLGAPLATLTIVNPVVAAAIGIGLLHAGAGLTVPAVLAAAASGLVAVAGVVLLATPQDTPTKPRSCRRRNRPDGPRTGTKAPRVDGRPPRLPSARRVRPVRRLARLRRRSRATAAPGSRGRPDPTPSTRGA
ncbi:DMT family transporter [Micromonospora sp. GCM10011542]|uniref:DMT family transporter n=1 Tax=Micromonospora sp. GCM10011542 TaxID=3317337 RepID=UPI003605E1E8